MSKRNSLWSRFTLIFKAKSHKALNKIEDTEEMAEQAIRDQENKVERAKEAISVAVGNFRLSQSNHQKDLDEHQKMSGQIAALNAQIDVSKANGDEETAAKLDAYLTTVIEKQMILETQIRADAVTIGKTERQIEDLKNNFAEMKHGLETLRSEKNALISRARSVDAMESILDVRDQIDFSSPTSDIGRLSAKIDQREARLIGRQEVTDAGDFDAQIAKLGRKAEVEARKAMIRSGGAAPEPLKITTGSKTV